MQVTVLIISINVKSVLMVHTVLSLEELQSLANVTQDITASQGQARPRRQVTMTRMLRLSSGVWCSAVMREASSPGSVGFPAYETGGPSVNPNRSICCGPKNRVS